MNNKYVLCTFPEYGTEAYQGPWLSSTQDRRVEGLEFEVLVSAESYFSADRATMKILHKKGEQGLRGLVYNNRVNTKGTPNPAGSLLVLESVGDRLLTNGKEVTLLSKTLGAERRQFACDKFGEDVLR